ncbi:MAG: AhpC/TSA family protein [Cytophagales bacterium]|nr:AhpC/TSA family protein [Cytophagales bacterium]
MKRYFCLLLLVLLGYSTYATGYQVKGNLLHNDEAKYVYLYEVQGNFILSKIDSAQIKKGKFVFKYEDKQREGVYHLGVTKKGSTPVVLAQESIIVTAEGTSFKTSIRIQNSPANVIYQKYIESNNSLEKKVAEVNKDFQQRVMPLEKKDPTTFQVEYQKLVQRIQAARTEYRSFLTQMAQHENEYMKKVGRFLEINEVTTKINYFSKYDLFDESLTRGDFIVRKINLYFTLFANVNQKTLAGETEVLLKMAPTKTKARAVVFEALTRATIPNDAGYAKRVVEAFQMEYPKNEYTKFVATLLPSDGLLNIGDKAPEIDLPSFDGKNIALSSLKGKVVLIDFWASWCGPCRRENPNVVKLYQEYRDKGFTVYSVSLDSKQANWVKAIQKDNLSWGSHVSELKKWNSSAARAYRVRSIPTTYLIDENGVIIGKNLRGQALEAKLASLFAGK